MSLRTSSIGAPRPEQRCSASVCSSAHTAPRCSKPSLPGPGVVRARRRLDACLASPSARRRDRRRDLDRPRCDHRTGVSRPGRDRQARGDRNPRDDHRALRVQGNRPQNGRAVRLRRDLGEDRGRRLHRPGGRDSSRRDDRGRSSRDCGQRRLPLRAASDHGAGQSGEARRAQQHSARIAYSAARVLPTAQAHPCRHGRQKQGTRAEPLS